MARAGRNSDRVTVERKSGPGTRDALGNLAAEAWAPLAPVAKFWGNLRETPGKERVAAGRLEAPATATLRLRRSTEALAITPADRIVARGHTWAIKGGIIDPDGKRREIELTLERGGAVE